MLIVACAGSGNTEGMARRIAGAPTLPRVQLHALNMALISKAVLQTDPRPLARKDGVAHTRRDGR